MQQIGFFIAKLTLRQQSHFVNANNYCWFSLME